MSEVIQGLPILRAQRDAIIEECAAVSDIYLHGGYVPAANGGPLNVSEAIRALKDKP